MTVYNVEPWALDDPELIDRLEDDGMFEAAEEIRRLQERFEHFASRPLIAASVMLLEGAADALEALKLLRTGLRERAPETIEVIDAHISELEHAIARARGTSHA